jgi:hypothetical protein
MARRFVFSLVIMPSFMSITLFRTLQPLFRLPCLPCWFTHGCSGSFYFISRHFIHCLSIRRLSIHRLPIKLLSIHCLSIRRLPIKLLSIHCLSIRRLPIKLLFIHCRPIYRLSIKLLFNYMLPIFRRSVCNCRGRVGPLLPVLMLYLFVLAFYLLIPRRGVLAAFNGMGL